MYYAYLTLNHCRQCKEAQDRLFFLRQRHAQVNKTLATLLRCHVDTTTVNEVLTEALGIPHEIIQELPQNEVIGEGRFGTCTKVFLHGTIVCAKIVHTPSCRAKAAIVHEAAILSKVRHPNICFLMGIQTTQEPSQLKFY